MSRSAESWSVVKLRLRLLAAADAFDAIVLSAYLGLLEIVTTILHE